MWFWLTATPPLRTVAGDNGDTHAQRSPGKAGGSGGRGGSGGGGGPL